MIYTGGKKRFWTSWEGKTNSEKKGPLLTKKKTRGPRGGGGTSQDWSPREKDWGERMPSVRAEGAYASSKRSPIPYGEKEGQWGGGLGESSAKRATGKSRPSASR